jgi:ATP-dependent RNA helicase DOB1
MTSLSEEDRELPQIVKMLPILKRGIGIHHGGLLPIVKEIIEILFQMGFLKILFSTETFSMGLNMPAKTVVFTSVRKFDGENFRWLTGGEYIQMSGRAGRRGIDDKGITILMIDEKMDEDVAQGMLKGVSDALNSAFHLSYNMLINSLVVEDTDPEFIIRRSFHQYQSDRALPEMAGKLTEYKSEIDSINISKESDVADLFNIEREMNDFREKIRKIVTSPQNILPFLAIGRVVFLEHNDEQWGWGAMINFSRKKMDIKKGGRNQKPNPDEKNSDKFKYIIDVMVHIKPRANKNETPSPTGINNDGEMEIVPMLISCIK